jgi:putative ABC transport system substrate-binding protein
VGDGRGPLGKKRIKVRANIMRNKIICLILFATLIALRSPAEAEQSTKVPRIAYLTANSPSANAARREAFRLGLRELGYEEGKNIVIEWRYAEGKLERNPALAAELVRLKVEVIVTGGDAATRAAKGATSTTPIVMAQSIDPIGYGFVASLARPGGNITGISNLSPELSGKRLELLKEVVPRLSRVIIFGNSTIRDHAQELKEVERTAGAFGAKLQYVDILSQQDIETAFRAAGQVRVHN